MFGEEKSLTMLTASSSFLGHIHLSVSLKSRFSSYDIFKYEKQFGELGKHGSHDFSTRLIQLQIKWETPESVQQSFMCCPFRLWTRHILRTLKLDSTVSLLLKRQGRGGVKKEGGKEGDRQQISLLIAIKIHPQFKMETPVSLPSLNSFD